MGVAWRFCYGKEKKATSDMPDGAGDV